MAGHRIPGRFGNPLRQRVQPRLGFLADVDVLHGSALDTDQMVMVALEPFGEFEARQAVGVVLFDQHARLIEHRQRSVDRGEGCSQSLLKLGGRLRTDRPQHGGDHGSSPGGVANGSDGEVGLNGGMRVGGRMVIGLHRSRGMITFLTMRRTILIFKKVDVRLATWAMAVGLLAVACGAPSGSNPPEGESAPTVVATTPILGDIVASVSGGAVRVEVLMGSGVDPHDFQPSARQAARLREADLVVVNGLGLEEGMLDVLESAEADGVEIVEAASLADPIPLGRQHDHHTDGGGEGDAHEADDHTEGGEEEAHDAAGLDPHFWLDPRRVSAAAGLVADRVAAIEGVDRAAVESAADRYRASLEELDAELSAAFSQLPTDRRRLVTNHESLGYLADRYGFEIVGVVIPGGSTLGEPSSAELAALVDTIRREGVAAVFVEQSSSSALAEAVAGELGEDVDVVTLYTEAFGSPDSGVVDYHSLMRANAELIVEALR